MSATYFARRTWGSLPSSPGEIDARGQSPTQLNSSDAPSAQQRTPSARPLLPHFTHSLPTSVTSRPSMYAYTSSTSATSERRAQRNRERDPDWVPRPANAFIIFRAEYSHRHAQAHKNDPPTAEKTLSKRAAEAWKKLTASEKEPYKKRSEQERLEHARRYPNYRYKPRRHSADASHPPQMSRREQVESFVRRAAIRARARRQSQSESDSASDYTYPESPASMTSSSSSEPPDTPLLPDTGAGCSRGHQASSSSSEPPDTPLLPDTGAGCSRGHQASSSPSQAALQLHEQLRESLFLSPLSSASTTCLRTQLAGDTSLRSCPVDIPSPYSESDIHAWSRDLPVASGDIWPMNPSHSPVSPPSVWTGQIPEESSDMDAHNSPIPEMVVSPVPLPLSPPQSSSEFSREGGHLFHRRRESAMNPSAFPSPLSVVTSSLAGWDGSPVPDITVSSSQSSYLAALSSTPEGSYLAEEEYVKAQTQAPSSNFLTAQGMEVDYDRTPRTSEFYPHVQDDPTSVLTSLHDHQCGTVVGTYPLPEAPIGQGFAYAQVSSQQAANYESYTMGLAQLGIEPMIYNMSPFEELVMNEFFDFERHRHTTP